MPRLVILESPYAGYAPAWVPPGFRWLAAAYQRWRNARYTVRCMRDSLYRGEAPLASHVLYASSGVLDDSDMAERARGLQAGFAWGLKCPVRVVYCDRGISGGMRAGMNAGLPTQRVEFRYLDCVPPRCRECGQILPPETRCICTRRRN